MNREYSEKYLGQEVFIKIDRPLGSKHPKHDILYTVNYGFIPGSVAPDGEEIDAYLLGVFEPVIEYSGTCIAVIQRITDNDDKLIIVPQDRCYSNEQIAALTEFQERFFQSIIVRKI